MDKYQFLFPFEKIKQGSKIIIYGAGDVGCEYLKQLLITNYCTCVALLDRNAANIAPLVVPVYTPENLPQFEYDYILLAFKDGCHVQAVKDTLLHYGADASKIFFQPVRAEVNILGKIEAKQTDYNYAFQNNGISIAIKYGPCLGDSIIKKKIVMELVKKVPEVNIDIYISGGSKFMNAIYADTRGLNNVIDDGGVLFEHNKIKYDVAFELYDLLAIKHISDNLANKNRIFFDELHKLDEALLKYNLPSFPISNMHIHFKRMIYKGLNVYNYLNFTGFFNIKDKNVDIKLNEDYLPCYTQLNLRKYVTINYGTGFASIHGKNVVAKQWNYDKLCQFVQLFKNNYHDIEVVQLGTKNAAKVFGADKYVLGADLELVKYVLDGSILHIDSEGGLVHLATQLGTKCVVLFGPTMVEYFGYDENDNIVAGDCHNCYTLYDEIDKCARGMECPECMDSITPNLVMEHVDRCISDVCLL